MTSDEVASEFYPLQMERDDWSDSFVYVTKYKNWMISQYTLEGTFSWFKDSFWPS